ncbi:hypothetical protein Tco_0154192 [Tanacetum coccineum]
MESQSKTTQTVSELKLPEVNVNGDAPAIASSYASTEGSIPQKLLNKRLAERNELKAKKHSLVSETHQPIVISQEDAHLKLLRSLPILNCNIALIMRNKYDLDTLSMDDLYNNLKVYESKIKVQSSSRSNSHNVVFVSSENTSSTNEAINTAHEVSTASSQGQSSSSTYANDVMFSFFSNQSKVLQIRPMEI